MQHEAERAGHPVSEPYTTNDTRYLKSAQLPRRTSGSG